MENGDLKEDVSFRTSFKRPDLGLVLDKSGSLWGISDHSEISNWHRNRAYAFDGPDTVFFQKVLIKGKVYIAVMTYERGGSNIWASVIALDEARGEFETVIEKLPSRGDIDLLIDKRGDFWTLAR